jgi:hypothetical protein
VPESGVEPAQALWARGDIKSLGNAGPEWHFSALYLTLLPQTVFDTSLKCG